MVYCDLKFLNILVFLLLYLEFCSLGFVVVKVMNFGLVKVEVFGLSCVEFNFKNFNFRFKKNLG